MVLMQAFFNEFCDYQIKMGGWDVCSAYLGKDGKTFFLRNLNQKEWQYDDEFPSENSEVCLCSFTNLLHMWCEIRNKSGLCFSVNGQTRFNVVFLKS